MHLQGSRYGSGVLLTCSGRGLLKSSSSAFVWQWQWSWSAGRSWSGPALLLECVDLHMVLVDLLNVFWRAPAEFASVRKRLVEDSQPSRFL